MNIYSHCAFIAFALSLAACSDSSEFNPAKPNPTANPHLLQANPRMSSKTPASLWLTFRPSSFLIF